jgi:nicotinate (nicotinamide) nucleotide adenylyltransferase/ribosome silencing factor RsfS/YbeB/iojap
VLRLRRIGLLGGSFNPAHRGHLHLSLTALQRLDLDQVWWLVSPQNPLKPATGMASFEARLEQARRFAAGHAHIVVTELEGRLGGSHYTADTLRALCHRFPRVRFVWLMGADNLLQLREWRSWTEIFEIVPIAVFDRPSYSRRALAELPARRFARRRVAVHSARRLAEMTPPAWVFFHTPLDPVSATRLRADRQDRPAPAERNGSPSSTIATLFPRPRPGRPAPAALPRLLEVILATLEDGKAEDIVTIELAGKTTIADQMVIASGRSTRQVVALTEHLEQALSRRSRHRASIEGKVQGDWVLIDAGDVIVHIFRPEIRAYYNLEKMWRESLPDGEAVRQ